MLSSSSSSSSSQLVPVDYHQHHHQQQNDLNEQELIVDLSKKGRQRCSSPNSTSTSTPANNPSQAYQQHDLLLNLSVGGGVASPCPSTDTENESSKSGGSSGKRKKARTTFTGKQIYEMERKFEIKKYLSSNERTEMARILNVTETQVRKTHNKTIN